MITLANKGEFKTITWTKEAEESFQKLKAEVNNIVLNGFTWTISYQSTYAPMHPTMPSGHTYINSLMEKNNPLPQ